MQLTISKHCKAKANCGAGTGWVTACMHRPEHQSHAVSRSRCAKLCLYHYPSLPNRSLQLFIALHRSASRLPPSASQDISNRPSAAIPRSIRQLLHLPALCPSSRMTPSPEPATTTAGHSQFPDCGSHLFPQAHNFHQLTALQPATRRANEEPAQSHVLHTVPVHLPGLQGLHQSIPKSCPVVPLGT
ncbi:hypothetical protein B0J11DRAFT_281698 [Dendryphion nanum]|uniref:Uncharacterized protein n=1 Tax=Dendryphion nanum TaxID=256645 RepID=A0A9P9DWC9_9PLEO|nr:hypothetical protein B0J11DRAFT_281698 [Dendryphion nanum]